MSDLLEKCDVCKLSPRGQQWFTAARVAKAMARNARTVRRLVACGDLEAVRFGRSLNISHESLDRYLATRSTADEG
jgi:excisionase family DNA binding protein